MAPFRKGLPLLLVLWAVSAKGDALSKPFCRVYAHIPGGMQIGSGTLIETSDNRGIVLTNQHVISGASKVVCSFMSQEKFEARVLASEPGVDLAVLAIKVPEKAQPISIGDLDPSRDLVMNGCGPNGRIRHHHGRVTGSVGYKRDGTSVYEMRVPTREGDSGGAVTDARTGELVGVVHSTNGQGSIAAFTHSRDVQRFLAQYSLSCPSCPGGVCRPPSQEYRVIQPPPAQAIQRPPQTVPSCKSCDCAQRWQELEATLEDLRAGIDEEKQLILQYKEQLASMGSDISLTSQFETTINQLQMKVDSLDLSGIYQRLEILENKPYPEAPSYETITGEVAKRLPPIRFYNPPGTPELDKEGNPIPKYLDVHLGEDAHMFELR